MYCRLFSFSLQGFRKGAALVLSDSESKVGEKLEMLLWRVVAKYLRKLEEFRIQSSLPVEKQNLEDDNRNRIEYPQVCIIVSIET